MSYSIPIPIPIPIPIRLDQFSVFAKPVFPHGQTGAAGGETDTRNRKLAIL